MDKSNFENVDGICECKNLYSVYQHGDGHALMFAACPHRHGYNLGNIQEADMPMLRTMTDRLNGLADARAIVEERDRLRASLTAYVNESRANFFEAMHGKNQQIAALTAELTCKHCGGRIDTCGTCTPKFPTKDIDRLTAEVADREEKIKMLIGEIISSAEMCGIVDKDWQSLTGPEAIMLCQDMAKGITTLTAELAGMREALVAIASINRDVPDCRDNSGNAYQSEWLNGIIIKALGREAT